MLAIGFSAIDEGFAASPLVEKEFDNAQSVSDFLYKEFGIVFDQILVVGCSCHEPSMQPEVYSHWNLGKDYELGEGG